MDYDSAFADLNKALVDLDGDGKPDAVAPTKTANPFSPDYQYEPILSDQAVASRKNLPSLLDLGMMVAAAPMAGVEFARKAADTLVAGPVRGLANLMTAPLSDVVRSGDRDAMRKAAEASFDVAGALPAAGVAAGRTMPDGAAGIFGGRLAKTADQAELKRAEDMAAKGAPRENIWNQTGWFKGVDGKWRFEIDDSQAEYLGGVKTARRFDKAIDHPDLAAAYPGLGAAPVRGVKPSEEMMGMVAAYNPLTNEFALRNAPEFDAKTKSSGLHEAQHYIQGEEGFAQGSSEALARGDLNDRAAAAQISAHEAAIADKPTGLRYFSPKAWEDYYARLAETMTDRLRSRREAAETPRSRREILDAYKQSAGEVESRTVQKRMNLTADQRRARPPWLDYDVPENQQIVRLASNPDDLNTSAILLAMQGQDKPSGITAYHGSPHDFDKFDMSKVGTGEGAQAYGHGLYFAENEGVARSYRDTLAGSKFPDGSAFDDANPAHQAAAYIAGTKSKAEAIAALTDDIAMSKRQNDGAHAQRLMRARGMLERGEPIPELNNGRMYEVRINADPNDFLDWDKPLSQQSEKARAAFEAQHGDWLKRNEGHTSRMTTGEIVRMLGGNGPASQQMASEVSSALREAGIPGIRYLDQGSRVAGEGSRNYVVFDDALVEILRKYANAPDPTTAAILALLTAQQGGQPQQ